MNDRGMRVWFAAFVLVVFCTGVGAGIVLDRLLGPRPGGPMALGPGPGGPFADPPGRGRGGRDGGPPPLDRLTDALAAELGLSAAQRTGLDALLRAQRDRLDAVRRESQGRFEAEQKLIRDEIRKMLTPEQQPRFDAWLAKMGPLPGPEDGPPPRGAGPRGR